MAANSLDGQRSRRAARRVDARPRPAPRSAAAGEPASRPARRAAPCAAGRRPRRRPRRPRARVAVVAGGSRRVQRRPGRSRRWAPARRRCGPIAPARSYVGVPGGLDRRHAVDLGAGRGGQPVGDLGLHHHQPALEAGQQAPAGAAAPARRRCRAGWPPARSAAGRAARRRAARRLGDQVEVARPAGHPGRRSWSAALRPAAGRSRRRRRARPPPAAPGSASRVRGRPRPRRRRRPRRRPRTMRRTVLASITKFCPRCLVGRTPRAAASSRMSAAPSKAASPAGGWGRLSEAGAGSVVLTG